MRRVLWLILAAAVFAPPLWADPCGLVPPIATQTDPNRYLTREGEQITYVFYKAGIQDVVLRPAFKGKVSEFGMLIPFPTPPAIRKVADDIFAQVSDAVEPPKVTIDLYPPRPRAVAKFAATTRGGDANRLEYRDSVRVIKEEAVGMYQVAVLDAGSAAALKKWMTTHGYVYPKGMDKPAQEYVDKGWCFVVVKARVGKKKGVQPRPGMKKTDPNLPEDATFSGAVQAMGFRFRVKEPVVPMRLSAYNPGKLYNIVYALTDKPVRFKQLPASFVAKQLPGKEVLANLTEPLPATYKYWDQKFRKRGTLEVARGALPDDLPEHAKGLWNNRKDRYEAMRDPVPHNGKAKALFASDLLAARRGKLIHAYEERQKELLNIGEELDLRGPEVDAVIHEQIEKWKKEELGEIIKDLEGMTLTVIKGDFPREILRDNDLTFLAHGGPGDPVRKQEMAGPWFFILLLAAAGVSTLFRRGRRAGGALIVALLAGSFAFSVPAQDKVPEEIRLAKDLADASKRAETVEALLKRGREVAPLLQIVARMESIDITARGWALVCIARIGDPNAANSLTTLANDERQPSLVRLWSVGALAAIDPDPALDLIFARLSKSRILWIPRRFRQDAQQDPLDEALLGFVTKSLGRRQPSKLIERCLQGKDNTARRMAAAILGNADLDSETVRTAYISSIKYDAKAAAAGTPPWQGGALFIPGVAWTQEQLNKLIVHLSRWHEWAAVNQRTTDLRVISNNMVALQRRLKR